MEKYLQSKTRIIHLHENKDRNQEDRKTFLLLRH